MARVRRSAASLLLVLGLASPAWAVDVELAVSSVSNGTLCSGVVSGVGFCDTTSLLDGEVTVLWSLDSEQLLNGYDLTVAWDASELTLLTCEQLYPDTQPPGTVGFLIAPCDADDPVGSDALTLSLTAFDTTALFSLTFGVAPVLVTDGLADVSWTPNGNGLSPASVVLTNTGGAGVDLGDLSECSNGIDDDGDGLVDADGGGVGDPDPGCDDPADASERSALLVCDNGLDDDLDGRIDFDPVTAGDPALGVGDPGCWKPDSDTESPQCNDGVENDADGLIDFDGGQWVHGACGGGVCPPGVSDPDSDGVADPDPQCVGNPSRNAEKKKSGCGLGPELVLLLGLLHLRRRRA